MESLSKVCIYLQKMLLNIIDSNLLQLGRLTINIVKIEFEYICKGVCRLWKTFGAYPPQVFSPKDLITDFGTSLMEPFITCVALCHT